jgi:hypothetical protein
LEFGPQALEPQRLDIFSRHPIRRLTVFGLCPTCLADAAVTKRVSGIAQTSCNRYNKVINGLRNARLGLPDNAMLYDKDVRRILKDTEFGCTVHSTVFDVQEEPDLPWE